MIEDWTLESLGRLVGRMRGAQLEFHRNLRWATADEHHRLLQASLTLEADVDRALAEIAERRPLFDREDAS